MAESGKESSESRKQSLTGLARRLGRLPGEKRKAALEMSASLAGVSLRVSREFVEAVPKAAKILSADDLRQWAEMGRRLAMADAELGADDFKKGVNQYRDVSKEARPLAFQICSRQLVLSSSIAIASFESIPRLSKKIGDDDFLFEILKLAADIAGRSAKHSAEFLDHTPAIAQSLKKFGDDAARTKDSVIKLAAQFAARTGGMTADLWKILPESLAKLSGEQAVVLTQKATEFLEFGGSVTLHFIKSGGEVVRRAEAVFEDWCGVLLKIGASGNAILISFIRSTPQFIANIVAMKKKQRVAAGAVRVIALVAEIAETDPEAALAAFRSSTTALRKVSLVQFEDWVKTGLEKTVDETPKARRSFFALETRNSNVILQDAQQGLPLETIQTVLRIYIEGLTGKEVEIAPLSAMPEESRLSDGKTIYLPSITSEFETDEMVIG